ncbi:PREDICTED: uncharacterized protein LOC105973309 [Erythranthe guttata]|uniref:uncharacterized protein LOC105973309 n=1 Tax=Erythranthe guttata TaxID=4155 RepID=UPI00064D87E9|nr:PREDICTED: uncharacterized protein LOC105973309 [Erythranthe guttata]|eukprot:XP_012853785.1 PREDICTED: uncharacterized protein LOC105973309 [Erythranthe guttata]
MVNAHVTGEPWCKRWQVIHHIPKDEDILVDYRRRLDSMRPSDVNWTPFGLKVASEVGKTVHHGTIRWMDTVEPYMPDRVLRQFGFRQIKPADLIRPLKGAKRERKIASYKVNYEPGDQMWSIPHTHMLNTVINIQSNIHPIILVVLHCTRDASKTTITIPLNVRPRHNLRNKAEMKLSHPRGSGNLTYCGSTHGR